MFVYSEIWLEIFVIFVIDSPLCEEHGNVSFEDIKLVQKKL